MNMQFGLEDNTINKMRQVFASHPEISDVVIYGSRAMGNYRQGSDIDICLNGELLNLKLLNQIENELEELNLPYSMDVSIYHQIDNPELVDHIDRVGVSFHS